jgi:hypothetical protein
LKPLKFHEVPGRPTPEPDWDGYFHRSFRIIQRMIPSMDDVLLQESWSGDLDLFFIHRRFGRLENNVRTVSDHLREMVDPGQVPSASDIQALTEGRAISLMSVCRLRYCLEEARRVKHERILFYFSIDRMAPNEADRRIPITAGKVIPTINVFDKTRYAEAKAALPIAQGELTAFAGRAVGRNLNPSKFEGELENGSISESTGRRTGYYRLTDHMARIVYEFLLSKAGPAGYALQPQNYYLPRDPTYGPGRGKWCRSLVRNSGNYWPA